MKYGRRLADTLMNAPVLILVFLVFVSSVSSSALIASEIDPAIWPESWHQKAKAASEFGMDQFFESPLLTIQVKAGELAPTG